MATCRTARTGRLSGDFRRYWIGEALSNVATRTSTIAYPLLALSLTGSPALAGFVGFARLLPYFLFSLPVGALVDRLDRRRLMIACDISAFVPPVALALVLVSGKLVYAELVVLAAVQGICAMVFRIAEVGAVRHLVEDDDLPTAVAQNVARDSAAWLAGPPLGGLLYAISRFLPFVVDAASFFASAVALHSIKRPFNEERARSSTRPRVILGEIREG